MSAGVKLSSIMTSAPASSTGGICSSASTSTSIANPAFFSRAVRTAAASLSPFEAPAAARWLSFSITRSKSPILWLYPPPHAKAYFSSTRNPGVVLRVSSNFVGESPSASTYFAVSVATPDSLCRKFNIMRSACNITRAEPSITPSFAPFETLSPSFARGINLHSKSSEASS